MDRTLEPSKHPNMTHKKKLIEVALPLEAINAACKADKDRKTGSIRNLHKWFAPMPVPALRAIIFAALVDDPASDEERHRLLALTEALVESDVEQPRAEVLAAARAAIAASTNGDLPTVLDPFCGGGSTLVEAQRLGLQGRGNDLNPLPVLISRVLTQYIPSFSGREGLHPSSLGASGLNGFRSDVDFYAEEIIRELGERVGAFYKTDHDDEAVAWWWVHEVESPDPRFQGKMTPIASSWALSKKKGDEWHVIPSLQPDDTIGYEVAKGLSKLPGSKDVCLLSGAPITFEYLRSQGQSGKLRPRLVAVMTQRGRQRKYFAASSSDIALADSAIPTAPPTQQLPEKALSFGVQGYGLTAWSELFLPRNLLLLENLAELIRSLPTRIEADGGDEDYARAITDFFGLCLGKLAQYHNKMTLWYSRTTSVGKVERAFPRHDVTLSWDFPEPNPFASGPGSWTAIVKGTLRAFDFVPPDASPALVTQGSAQTVGAGLDDSCLIVTDPPYFSSIGYADVSDFFYVIMRPALREVEPALFATLLTPKAEELIASRFRHGGEEAAKQFFISGFTETFTSIRRASREEFPICIVYAFKENAGRGGGWEAMLRAIVDAGLAIVGTWPIRGTGTSRMVKAVGGGTNSLATYVLLVCRPRESESARITRRELTELMRSKLAEVIPVLQDSAIAPVDLAQAIIGPAFGEYSRYATILEPDGSSMSVRDALLLANNLFESIIEEQDGDLDEVSMWAASWYEQYRYAEQDYDDAERLARSKAITVEALVRAGIVTSGGGRARLLARSEMPDDYSPREDRTPTAWEAVQHLVKALDRSESHAARLMGELGQDAERARSLVYRLFQACNRNGWAEEGQQYNALVSSWPELVRLGSPAGSAVDDTLF